MTEDDKKYIGSPDLPRGYEVSQQMKTAENIQSAIIQDVSLRKWCVEKAMEAFNACDTGHLITLANQIFEFVSAPPPMLKVRGFAWEDKERAAD